MKRIILLLMLLVFTSASAEDDTFTAGEPHTSTPAFAQYFKTMTAELPAGTLSIAQRIFVPWQADALLTAVRNDLEAIAAYTGMPLQSHTVYVVERLVNGSIERQGNRVYVQAAEVLSGDYRPLLVCAALGTEEYWIGVGLTGCIWGSDADESILSARYADGDIGVLTLAVPYFLADFATPEEIALAQATAVSLCRFAMEHDGCNALLTDNVSLRREWLRSIGIDRDYSDPYRNTLSQYRFRASANYTLIAEDPHGNTVHLAPMEDMCTARDLCLFLHDLIAGPELLIARVAAEAPDYSALLQSRWSKLRIYCGQAGSWAVPEYREIRLALGAGFMHELMHILVPPVSGANFYSTMWQYEGLCYWAGYQAYPMAAQRWQFHQALQLFGDMDTPQTPNHRFSTLAVALYLQRALLPDTPDMMDAARYAHAMAIVPLRWPEAAPDAAWAATIHDSYPGTQNANGNELTEFQAFSFTAYLIEKHGLSSFLRFCVEGSAFGDAFGIPYEAEREGWISMLNTMFD